MGLFLGHQICKRAIAISHLLFANDSLVFCRVSVNEAKRVKHILHLYELKSGQQVNFAKSSIIFSKGVPKNYHDKILITMDMKEVHFHEKYLGLPTHVGRAKIKDKVAKNIIG